MLINRRWGIFWGLQFYKAVMEESGGTYDEENGEYVADDEETQEMLDNVSVFIRVGEEPEEDD